MANITNSEFQTWVNRINAIRTKHGLSSSGLSAPGAGTKITAAKINTILNATIGSTWITGALGSTVSSGTKINTSKQTEINNKLTTWEGVCVFNSIYSNNANFSGNFSSNFTDWGDTCRNFCSGADWNYYEAEWSTFECSSDWDWCTASDNSWSCNDDRTRGNCFRCSSDWGSDDSQWGSDRSFNSKCTYNTLR